MSLPIDFDNDTLIRLFAEFTTRDVGVAPDTPDILEFTTDYLTMLPYKCVSVLASLLVLILLHLQ